MAKLKLVQVFDPIGDWSSNPSTQQELISRLGYISAVVPENARVEIFTDGKHQYAKFCGFKLPMTGLVKGRYARKKYFVRIDGFFLGKERERDLHRKISVETLQGNYKYTKEHGNMISSKAPISLRYSSKGYIVEGRHPNMLQYSAIPAQYNYQIAA